MKNLINIQLYKEDAKRFCARKPADWARKNWSYLLMLDIKLWILKSVIIEMGYSQRRVGSTVDTTAC